MKAVFIVGTGRSGTHFTVRLLNGFANTRDPLGGKESPEVLRDIAEAAIHHRLPSEETRNYYESLLVGQDGVVLDQHHPNLFFAGHWSSLFDDIVFLYPDRPTHQIVASMLKHKGVMGWYGYARRKRSEGKDSVPFPNQFLGIDRLLETDTLPRHLLCACRVIAHRQEFQRQVNELGTHLRSVDYTALVANPLLEFSRVFSPKELAELGEFTLAERPRASSLEKYLDVLDEKQIEEIALLEQRLGPFSPA